MPARLFVLGTFDQAETALYDVDLMRCLHEAGITPAGVVYKRSRPAENPDRPVENGPGPDGRHLIHVHDFNATDLVQRLGELSADLLIYAGGRDLLRGPLLASARLGCIGGHYGRLPEMRGMGTPEWSVLIGQAPTVAVQRMTPGVDVGDVVMQARVPLLSTDNFASIRERSYYLTKTMLALAARRMLLDDVAGTPQAPGVGRQYYRLHPALHLRAERKLTRMLSAAP